eukprot:55675-Eustigmatos_ZCMA.PRE.1
MDQLLNNPLASYKSFLHDMSDDFMVENEGHDFKVSLQQDNDMKTKTTQIKGKTAPGFDADVKSISAYHFSLSGMPKEIEVHNVGTPGDASDGFLDLMDPDIAPFKLVKSGEYADEVYEYRLKERFGKIPTLVQVGKDLRNKDDKDVTTPGGGGDGGGNVPEIITEIPFGMDVEADAEAKDNDVQFLGYAETKRSGPPPPPVTPTAPAPGIIDQINQTLFGGVSDSNPNPIVTPSASPAQTPPASEPKAPQQRRTKGDGPKRPAREMPRPPPTMGTAASAPPAVFPQPATFQPPASPPPAPAPPAAAPMDKTQLVEKREKAERKWMMRRTRTWTLMS